MKRRFVKKLALVLLCSSFGVPCSMVAQGTAFTYQGRLNDAVNPANGSYDLRFAIYDSASQGTLLAGPLTNSATAVNNGLFTVTIDFGQNVFSGPIRWLEIGVRTNGNGSFSTLDPRQNLTAAPYAITAGNLTGPVPPNSLLGSYPQQVIFNNSANVFSGNGAGLSSVNATSLNGFGYCNLPCYWNLTGNAGTTPGVDFLGTTDNQPLMLKVNNVVALNIIPGLSLPNIVAGYGAVKPPVLGANVSGVVIAGGGAPSAGFSGLGGGDFMAAFDDDGVIGGGFGNKVGTDNGDRNDAAFATVGGGIFNGAANFGATVGGGAANLAGGSRAVVAGGNGNQAMGDYSFVGGGFSNTGSGVNATVSGGSQNVGSGTNSTVSGGYGNTSSGFGAVVSGGYQSLSTGIESTVGGGYLNQSSSDYATVSGGFQNTSSNLVATVGGGNNNVSGGYASTVPGGYLNLASGDYSFAAGNRAKAIHQGSFVWADSQNANFNSTANDQFCLRAQGGLQFSTNTSAFFGTQTRQMLNLWGTQYGIGVQTLTLYCRSDGDFSWFKGGVHNDGVFNPGAGGKEMMRLDSAGNLNIAGTFGSLSDRNVKENFQPVSAREILDKVAALPLTRWNYKEDKAHEHIGPMAQDFYAAFAVGLDERHITTVDEGGVSLAAIQGLNQKVEELKAELNRRDAETSELKAHLEALERKILDSATTH
ncbi:MAG TPA: tail fiber domain-containing protein [Verrucomicrobiae bacterium]|nr:tail fiber domain-containing protein [Verrucomicrobiae bacterium]